MAFDSGTSIEELAVQYGHYPEDRSENKGTEPEAIEYARFGHDDYLFVGTERGSFVAVYKLDRLGRPSFEQLLPAPLGPEGLLAIPQRNLLVASGETDDPSFGVRSTVVIYELKRGKPSYPQILSDDSQGSPIPWSALSGMTSIARMGAGILECDVTFTKDGELVCRHDQCDLHTTTNILITEHAGKCSEPFSPAEFDGAGNRTSAASALCCTSDLTLAEFKSLKGKMDASNPNAKTEQEFQGGTANWRTDLYSTGGTLLSHKESIQLIKSLGAKFTPELKGPNRNAKLQVETVFGSQEGYAQAMIDDYKEARISPRHVWAQSFNRNDVLYWIEHEPRFGKQAV